MEFDEIIKINNLFEYDINTVTIKRLIQKNITISMLMHHRVEEIQSLADYEIKPNTIIKIQDVLSAHVDDVLDKCSIHILFYLGLAKGIFNRLIDNRISLNEIANYSAAEMKTNYGFTLSTSTKIEEVLDVFYNKILSVEEKTDEVRMIFELRKAIVDQKTNKYLYEECADKVIKVLENNVDPMNLFMISRKVDIGMENLNKIINFLVKSRRLESTPLGLMVKRESLEEYLESISDNPKIDILKMKLLDCLTLEEIGNKYNLTRERIRQIVKKEIDKFPPLFEDSHYKIFTNCKVTREEFYKLFGENPIEFNYLSTRYKSGDKEIEENDLKNENLTHEEIELYFNPEESKVQYYYEMRNVVESFKGYFKFPKAYKEFQIQYPDIELSERNFSARLERMEFIVNSGRKGFRYFDLEAIEQSDFLERIDFNRYQEKCISSLLIFNDYSDLMNEFLIRNEYELHNILKWLDSKNYFLYPDISFGRMPMIEFDGFKKEDMVEHLIHESDGLTVEEFLEKLYAEYGYRQDTFLNVVVTGFPNYISNGIIVDNDLLSLDDETKLKEILVNDFYFFEEFKNLVESKDVPFEKMTLGNAKQVGYRRFSKYFLSTKYESLKEFFTMLLTSKEVFSRDDYAQYWHIISFNTILLNMKRDLDLFEYQSNEYICYKRLNEVMGINKDDLKEIKNQLIEMFNDKRFFTIKYAKKNGFTDIFIDYDFNDYFYKSIFTQDELVKVVSVNNTLLFGVTDKTFTISDLLEEILTSYEIMSRYELDELLWDDYGIKLELFELRNAVNQIGGYYCEVMDRVYVTYDLYLEET